MSRYGVWWHSVTQSEVRLLTDSPCPLRGNIRVCLLQECHCFTEYASQTCWGCE